MFIKGVMPFLRGANMVSKRPHVLVVFADGSGRIVSAEGELPDAKVSFSSIVELECIVMGDKDAEDN